MIDYPQTESKKNDKNVPIVLNKMAMTLDGNEVELNLVKPSQSKHEPDQKNV